MKLLIVEDEMELANFLKRGFRYEGFKVDHSTDGKGVAEQLKKKKYDVMILDLLLPTVSGEQVLKAMREAHDTTPVLVLTAVDDIQTKTKILNLGADDYLIKPFSFVELVARIKAVERRTKGAGKQARQLKVGNLVLDPQTRLVTREDKPIKLRFKEYVLLEYFMRNPDMVISRDTLIENVWKYNAKVGSNTVDSHVSLLRKKLNQGFDCQLIETVHGVGYILRSKPL